MAFDIGADEYVSAGGPTETPISAPATAVGVAAVSLQATFLRLASATALGVASTLETELETTKRAVAVGVAAVSKTVGKLVPVQAGGGPTVVVSFVFNILAEAVAVGVADVVYMFAVTVEVAAAAIGVPRALLNVSKLAAPTLAGIAQCVRFITQTAHAATAVGVPTAPFALTADIQSNAVAVGVPASIDADIHARDFAAVALGVADCTPTFVPYTPSVDPSPTDGAEDRTLLVRLSKWIWGA